MGLKLHTIICQVADMDRSVAFYRDVLGLSPGHTSPYWSDFTVGAVRIGLHPPFEGSAPPYSSDGKGWILGIETEDIRALRSALSAAGIGASEGYHDVPGGTTMDFRDPDGHPLQAIQVGISAKDLA